MSLRSFFVIGLALFCGLCAAVGVASLKTQSPQTVAVLETETIVVAAIDIPRGSLISAELLTTKEVPKEQLADGMLTKVEDAVERAVIIQLLAGEPILDKKLANRDEGRGISPLVVKGMRAFTILTPTPAASVAGFIMPSNRVDVLLTVSPSGRDDTTGGGSTTTLMQNVEIIAVNRKIDLPNGEISTEALTSVTLLVNPEQVAKLTLAQNRGTLNLSLRNDGDNEDGDARPVTMIDLRYSQEELAARREAEATPVPAPVLPEPVVVQVPPPVEPAVVEAPEREVVYNLRIRTLRGTAAGAAWLQYQPPRTVKAKDMSTAKVEG